MKKTLLSVLSILCFCCLSAYAADKVSTSSNANSMTQPSFEKMGQPSQDGNFANRPVGEPKGGSNAGQRPNKKPDSKPGGDRIPPEFQSSNNSSPTTTNSK